MNGANQTVVYLDAFASTPIDPRVREFIQSSMELAFANPSNKFNWAGKRAADYIDYANQQVLRYLGWSGGQVVFTSGCSEGNNTVIAGIVLRGLKDRKPPHIITSAIEHKSILKALEKFESLGLCTFTLAPPLRNGVVDAGSVLESITPQTALVSIMFVNNEVGTLQPVREIRRICKERNIAFHTDITQAIGKIPREAGEWAEDPDFVTFSAHKFYGPKGIGALAVRRETPGQLVPLIAGGGQQDGLRAGTENVPGIAGLGKALELVMKEDQEIRAHLEHHDRYFRETLVEAIPGISWNVPQESCVPGCLNFRIADVEAALLLEGLPEIAFSTGSACALTGSERSHVLKALGISQAEADSAVRFSLTRFTTTDEVDFAIKRLAEIVGTLRANLQKIRVYQS
jgi:cysteine desulfurase